MAESPWTRTPRVRCNYCGKRIPASVVICPNCHRNPRAFYWKRSYVVGLALLALIVMLGAAFWFADDLQKMVPANIAFLATPTRTATRAPATIFVVATSLPKSPTRVPPTPTATFTATLTPTPAPPTSTGTITRAPTEPPQTETPSPIPTIALVPPPKLVAPMDGEHVSADNKRVILQFQPAQPLNVQEWFRVEVDFLDRIGNAVSWCGFTRASFQEFPREYFEESSPNVRSFLWRVNVVRSNQFNPTTCEAPYDILSAPSEIWKFEWY